ncbi:MAG: DUF58 domain-containing protein [Acidobacteriota bacterium]|nr:MAG: DUF58 domain-containing protein [Acidobacteriota bacterium]
MAKHFASRFIDPEVLAKTANLQVIAKTVVEGFISGLHRSPYHGFSLEFAEYREYTPGDDIRRVDWKVFGRSDRFYVKKFEGDTNTQVYLLLDSSRSMSFASHKVSKLDYARYLAASLAFFAVRQHDAVGLLNFDSEIRRVTPPKAQRGHLMTILHHLEDVEVTGSTRIAAALEELSKLIRKRSLVVLISDLYEAADDLARALRFFHHRGNDVVLFHVLDPHEIELPLDGVLTLEDMETGEQIPFAFDKSRRAYLDELKEHIRMLKKECSSVRIDYELLRTDRPLDEALLSYLSTRSRRI